MNLWHLHKERKRERERDSEWIRRIYTRVHILKQKDCTYQRYIPYCHCSGSIFKRSWCCWYLNLNDLVERRHRERESKCVCVCDSRCKLGFVVYHHVSWLRITWKLNLELRLVQQRVYSALLCCLDGLARTHSANDEYLFSIILCICVLFL